MVAIARTSASPAPSTGTTAASPARPAAAAVAKAVVVELSDRARAIIDKAKADQAAAGTVTDTFDEMLAKRTDALSERLSKIFGKMNVPPEYATHLKVDKFGTVSSEGPWKEKIEQMFRDSPDLAKELKQVSGLNSLKAAQASLDMLHEQLKSTMSEKRQAEVRTNYELRAINIQTLSGVMTMKDGKLRSAAMDYMDMLRDPHGLVSGTPQKEIADRLA